MTPPSSDLELEDGFARQGPFCRAIDRLSGWAKLRGLGVGFVIGLIAWLPLVILTGLDRTLVSGPTIPEIRSFGTHARLLVAIPLFLFAESLFTERLRSVLRDLLKGQIVAGHDMPRLIAVLRQARQLWNSGIAEASLVVLVGILMYFGLRADLPVGVTTWRTTADGRLSLAGWWYTLVSLPLFQFLLWRWAWRLFVWGRLLYQISRFDLRLLPTHPDRAAGLGPLGVAHVDLAPLNFACAAMAAATFAEQIKFAGQPLSSYAVPAVAIVIGGTAVLVAPLLVFGRRLLEVKQRGLLEYGAFAEAYVRAFDAKWLRGAPGDEPLLGTADLQSLADLGNSFGVIDEMQALPISWRQIWKLTVAAALPMLPLLLFAFPLDQLIIGGIKMLIGG
jgi:hypothetical protein